MPAVRFSVVIPTRERAATLRYALRTCLEQQFDDYEVIVSDNCSSPATKAVVDEAASPKVRYVRTHEPVAMSTNWEFALSHARGEYVTVLGDDDGLLPHALAHLDRLITAQNPKAIRWELAFYTWPSVIFPGQENYLRVPLGNVLAERDGREVLRAVAELRESYEELPMVYNSAVRHDVLEGLRARTGAVFAHPIPDVYSGFAVAYAAERFLNTTMAMAVRGVSGASNGVATLHDPGRTSIEHEFHALNAKAGFRSDPTVPNLPALPAYATDAFLTAQRLLFPELAARPDRRALARACLSNARVSANSWPAALAAVRRSLSDDPELIAWFDAELANSPHVPLPPVMLKPTVLGFDGAALHLDAAEFDVADVAAAAKLCEKILHHSARITQDNWPVDVVAMTRRLKELLAPFGADATDMLRRALGWWELVEQVRSLRDQNNTLQAVCEEREDIIHRLDDQTRQLLNRLQAERRWSLKRPVRLLKQCLAKLTRRGAGKPTASG